MPIKVLMPALSPTMLEGNLAKWVKKEGDSVESGDVIAEIETDKATMEVEAVDDGVIGKILVPAGTKGVKVNEMIAILLEEGENDNDMEAILNSSPDNTISSPPYPPVNGGGQKTGTPASGGGQKTSPAGSGGGQKTSPAGSRGGHLEESPASGGGHLKESSADGGEAKPAPSKITPPQAGGQGGENKKADSRIFASPLAKRIAADKGVDLANIQGSGPKGRIVKADVEGAAGGSSAPSMTASVAPAQPGGDQKINVFGMVYTEIPNNNIKKITASRLQESKQTVPHFYLSIECRIDELMRTRKAMNDIANGEYKLSVNDFIVKACANALQRYPNANVSWSDEAVRHYVHADISVAVSTPNGLMTPIVKQAETKGLKEISAEVKDLAARAREGKLKPEEFQGGTFSVSNLGMYGIKEFGAILNPPQACILAVGAGEQKPYVDDGNVKIGTFMSCTLSVDHRAVDGAVGAEYLQILKTYLENPAAMLL